MKRSVLMSALVLGLASAMAMTACGGGTPGAASGDDAKKDDSGGSSSGPASTGDPVADAKALSDNLQKEIDDAFQVIRDSDSVLDGIAMLPKDLKAAKGFNKAKLMVQVQLVVGGGDADIDSLGITDADAKQKVVDRVAKLKALVAAIKGADDTAKKILDDIAAAAPKIAANVAKALPGLQAKIKAPFGVSADDKAKATADMKTLTDIKDGFEVKVTAWKKDLTDLPTKAKTIPPKLAALK
jgi:hypothetical protein